MAKVWEDVEWGLAAAATNPQPLLAFTEALQAVRRENQELPAGAAELALLDEAADRVRGPATAQHLVLEYGDYECPYSRSAYRHIQRVQHLIGDRVRFAFRHFPLTEIHPHALGASAAAEAAGAQGRFWEMHDRLFHHQHALTDEDLDAHAEALGLDVACFHEARTGATALTRIGRDVVSGVATGCVHGTPTLFIDSTVYVGPYDARTLTAHLGPLG
jgi:protein-disulfide isomerase